MKLKQFIQQETVLTAAAVLAVVSAFFVPPDAQYLGYIDLRTLAILFSLMTVMAGLRRQGFFDGLGRALLSRTHSTFQLTLVLVGLCFFGSMFITNDVSRPTPWSLCSCCWLGQQWSAGKPLPPSPWTSLFLPLRLREIRKSSCCIWFCLPSVCCP